MRAIGRNLVASGSLRMCRTRSHTPRCKRWPRHDCLGMRRRSDLDFPGARAIVAAQYESTWEVNMVRARRSVLYMQGANERALEKAKSLPADALILDLEDSVAPEAKPEARVKVANAVKEGGYGRR